MSGIIKPCPWCDSQSVSWFIKPFSRIGVPLCDDCGAQGPSFVARDQSDSKHINAEAIEAWNGGRS